MSRNADVDTSPSQAVAPAEPGFFEDKVGLTADVLKATVAFAVIGVVGRIGPLRRHLLDKAEASFEEKGVISVYTERKLWENAFDKPCTFAVRFLFPIMRISRMNAKVTIGGLAPNVKLLDGSNIAEKVLYDYQRNDRLLVLNIGSQSWGCFSANIDKMNELAVRFGGDFDFLTIYQREAHPTGGWEAPDQPSAYVISQAADTQERVAAAQEWFRKVDGKGNLAVDGIENHALNLFASFPDRILVINAEHRFVHVQPVGPRGYQPDELASFLESQLRNKM